MFLSTIIGDDLCQLYNSFQLFSSGGELPKFDGHGQNRSKIDQLKVGVDGISYFSVILFSNQNHPV